ncbi:MAG: UDP-N-acetylmuramoyl-L-alanine--D-glutamate ligase [Firmicutes bacterium]|nr:UDP-N-acetylmuramoyl-L-alanine--D-glutamate ligase [Bacillota bacterium]MCL2256173.1 UDP-N-acetylmuramoyl-L-alanine--D-glutamate ligase [Bacillota bacterium]
MDNFSLFGKKALVVGAGISGKGSAFALQKMGASVDVFVGSSDEFSHIENDKFGSHDLVVVSPGIPLEHAVFSYAKMHEVPLIGELELGSRLFKGEIVAITGTNGKTTTTSLVGEMMRNAGLETIVSGNIGNSFAKCAVEENAKFAALETSSFQLETIVDFKPKVATILNISPDHLDYHGTMHRYAKAKLNIARNQTENDTLILSADDIELNHLKGFSPKSKVVFFSIKEKVDGAYLIGDDIYFCGEKICSKNSIKLHGEHNVKNALAATAMASVMEIRKDVISYTLANFGSAPHRLSFVGKFLGKRYFNDSKATNIASALSAANSMRDITCMIMGGSDKGYDFAEFFQSLPSNVQDIVLIGETANKIEEAGNKFNFFNFSNANSIEEAVEIASKKNVKNVLLSPACASFDMFKDYTERGYAFEKSVRKLI